MQNEDAVTIRLTLQGHVFPAYWQLVTLKWEAHKEEYVDALMSRI